MVVSRSSRSRVRTSLEVKESGRLFCSVYSAPETTSHIYSIRLMQLGGNEFRMNAGRFNRFSFDQQEHRVLIGYERLRDRQTVADGFIGEMVRWIAAAEFSTVWSMRGDPRDVSYINLEFSFADGLEAVYFALRWR